MSEELRHFKAWDYVVFSMLLVVSAVIGIYYRFTGGKQRTVSEYLLANRSMGILPVAFSLMASFMSAISILGVAAENYTFGAQFSVINIAYIFGTPVAAFVYLPVFFETGATSVYEYLERRFGQGTRLIASVIFQLQMVLYMGIVLYAPALALSTITGLSKWTSVISVGLVCTFYSTIGGMKAVLWTDVFQSILMLAAVIAVLINGFVGVPSIADFLRVVDDGGRLEFFRLDLDPTVRHTFWTQVIGGTFSFLTLYAVNQAQVQRLMTIGNLKRSQISLFFSWPILALLSFTTCTCGLMMYYKYSNCDPLTAKRIESLDQLFPLYVMDTLSSYPGLPGLFVSGVFSATLSTVSSSINSLAAVALEDYLKPFAVVRWSDTRQAFVSKVLVLLYGLVCIALTYVAEQLGGVLQASLTIFGIVGGPLLGLFSLGMFTVTSNQRGASFGFVCSLAVVCWIGFGAHFSGVRIPKLPVSVASCNATVHATSQLSSAAGKLANTLVTVLPIHSNDHIFYAYRLSYMWLAPIGFVVVFVVGYVFSLMTGGTEKPVDRVLISPVFHRLCGFQPIKTSDFNKLETVALNGDIKDARQLSPIITTKEYATKL